MSWIKTKIEIPKFLKPKERELLAESVIEFIRLRTLEGKDKNNRKFAKYSKAYAERKGVSRDSVDLFLSGELLEELKPLSHKSGEIVIGYDKGNDELNGKAEGNILGTYGNSTPVTKGRDYLGITKKDLSSIVRTLGEEVTLTDQDIDAIARQAARDILGIEFEDNEA